MEYAKQRMSMRLGNVRHSADLDGVSAQIDLIGVPWLNIGFEASAALGGICALSPTRPGH
jgi:hypothetical protein